jgi:hypothetical protein
VRPHGYQCGPHARGFTKNRDRLLDAEVAAKFVTAVLRLARSDPAALMLNRIGPRTCGGKEGRSNKRITTSVVRPIFSMD